MKSLWFPAPVWYLVILYRPGRKFIQLLIKITVFLATLPKTDQLLGKMRGVKGGRVTRKSV